MKAQSIEKVSQDPAFEFVATQSFDVWPGWGKMHVYRNKDTGELWAAKAYIDNDSNTETSPFTNWFRVKEVQTVRYEEIK